MSAGISESRFYMWRAVFAMAHLDGVVTSEEIEFADNYFEYVPFSDGQIDILKQDLKEQQSVNEMLIGVSEPSDMADFFQFAQMLVWCDGDYDRREQIVIERLTAEQMNRFNKAEVSQQIRETRRAAAIRRGIEDEKFRRQAKEVLGIGSIAKNMARGGEYAENRQKIARITAHNLFKSFKEEGLVGLAYNTAERKAQGTEEGRELHAVMDWMRQDVFKPPEEDVFTLWRAVFALTHADGRFCDEEKEYVEAMMRVFMFSDEQKAVIEGDLESPPDIGALFDSLKDATFRRQFFCAARTVVWCNGVFDDKERSVLSELRSKVANESSEYADELQWLEKKPVMPEDSDPEERQERIMRGMLRQMLDFYDEVTKAA